MKKKSHLFTLIFFVSVFSSVHAALIFPSTGFTLRDNGSDGTINQVDDTANGSGFYGFITNVSSFSDEFFLEFDLSGETQITSAILDFTLRNATTSGAFGMAKSASISYYAGTGVTDTSLLGQGTLISDSILTNTIGESLFSLDVTSLVSGFAGTGDFFGIRFHDPVWVSNPDIGGQLFYQDGTASLSITNVPEPSIIALFGTGLVGFGLARRRKLQT